MTWLTVGEAAQILHIGERAVRAATQQNRYQHRYVNGMGRGGKQLRIALESLPEKAQALYRGEVLPPVDILQFTGKQRKKADAKAWVVEQYHQSDLSPAEFVSWFNASNPPEDAISKSKLFRWQKKYQGKDVAALIDERGRWDIASNDIWFSDHHQIDVFVKSEDGTKVIRPWLTVFFDARSDRVVSFLVRNADPNATAVKKCFRLGVEQNGVPNEVYFDNGKDYRSSSFSKDYPMSLVNQLGIGTIYATPYHGAAKTVERFFGTFTNRFSRRFDTYTGCNAKDRPEDMQIPNEKILSLAPTFDRFVEQLSAYIAEYNQTPNNGIDMDGKCPDQVYSENLAVKRIVSGRDALRLLCGNSAERVVNRSGVSIKNNHYYNDALLSHMGERVMVVYDPDNIDKMAVFDTKGRAICLAEAKIRTPFRHTSEEDYIRAAKEKKAVRAIVAKYKPAREMDIHEIVARNQLMEKTFTETGKPDIVEHIVPQAAENSAILKATDRTETTRRIREEESVSATLLGFYQKQA